jgi:hypothetical protein
MGTIIWKVLDNDGTKRIIQIPNSFYVPESKIRLLSPQHWAQELNDNTPNMHGTWCATYSDKIVLHWQQAQIRKTIPIDQNGTNTGILRTIPNTTKYETFHNEFRSKQLHLQAAPSPYMGEPLSNSEDSFHNHQIVDTIPASNDSTTSTIADTMHDIDFDIKIE